MSPRDDFSETVKRALAARVGNLCSNPDCRALTSGPHEDVAKAVNLGVAAHITAAAPGGPRYDARLTPEQRSSIENAIWLCQNCAKLIDSDPARFPVALLLEWKAQAEDAARSGMGKAAVAPSAPAAPTSYVQNLQGVIAGAVASGPGSSGAGTVNIYAQNFYAGTPPASPSASPSQVGVLGRVDTRQGIERSASSATAAPDSSGLRASRTVQHGLKNRAPQGMFLRVFMLYSTNDREFAAKIDKDLDRHNLDVWIDQKEAMSDESILESLQAAIRHTDVFVAVISPHAGASRWAREELKAIVVHALRSGLVIIPVLIDSCSLPSVLHGTRQIDFANEYSRGLADLVATLRTWAARKAEKPFERILREADQAPIRASRARSMEYTRAGELAISLTNYGDAIDILRRATRMWPRNWDAHNLLATAFFRSKQFSDSEAILDQLRSQGVQLARVHYNLACLHSHRAATACAVVDEEADLALCFDNLDRSFRAQLVAWLKRYAGRTNPMDGIMNDPDLFYARQKSSAIDALLVKQAKSAGYKPNEKIVYGREKGCFSGGMRVRMADGKDREFSLLRCGDQVQSQTPTGEPTVSLVRRRYRLWETSGVTLNGRIIMTARQLLRASGEWKRAGDVQAGDSIEGACRSVIKILQVDRWEAPTEVHQLTLEGWPVFFVEGTLVHNSKH